MRFPSSVIIRLSVALLAAPLSSASTSWAQSTSIPAVDQAVSGTSEREQFTVRSRDGTNLSVEAKGDAGAPEILFIHGLRQSRLSWDKQFDDPALDGYRMVRFDLRGHGDSDKSGDLAAYADPDLWADDVRAVIEAAGLERPVLVGWSLGGYVAGAYLRAEPDAKVAGINLVSPVIAFLPDLLQPEAAEFNQAVTSDDLDERTRATVEFLAACFSIAPTPEEFDRMLVVNGMTPRAVTEGLAQLPVSDLLPAFEAFDGPILLTHGVHDKLVRVAMSERLRNARPETELHLYENSGHSAFFEEPERYNGDLATFMERLAR